MNVPHGIPRLIGPDAPHQKGIRQKLSARGGFAQQPGKGLGHLILPKQTGIDRHRHLHGLLAAALIQPQYIPCGQGSVAQVIISPVQKAHPVPPENLLVGHKGEQAAVIHFLADVEVVLAAQVQVGGDAALYPQPGDDDGAVVAHHLNHLRFFALKHRLPGKGPGACQPPQADTLQHCARQHAQRRQHQQNHKRAHALSSVGTETRPSTSRMKSPLVCW